ncbi:MAG: hypothetical protein AAGF11_08320 [Myxococcota bacterium]
MIPVRKAPRPPGFDDKVRKPGLRAIAEMVGKTPSYPRRRGRPFLARYERERDIPANEFPTYWTKALGDLMDAYGEICAYSCFRIHRVTGAASADHFAAKSRSWRKVYLWSNYRLCCSRLNARKREFGDVLDPFDVKPSWFQLELVGFQVKPNPRLAVALRDGIQATIDRLGLDDFRHQREEDAERYWRGDISLRVLREESPFVAKELRRQGRLNPGDAW